MKKQVAAVLCSALALSVFSTGFTLKDNSNKAAPYDHAVIIANNEKKADYSKDILASNGLGLISQMDKMAESESYRAFISGSDELNAKIMEMGEGDYTTPKAVYKAVVSDEVVESMAELKVEDEIKDIVKSKLVASIPSQLNALNGVTELAASASVTAGNAIANETVKDNMVYVFIYDGDYSAAVAYTAENGIVSAIASFVSSYDLTDVESANDLNKLFADSLGISLEFALVK